MDPAKLAAAITAHSLTRAQEASVRHRAPIDPAAYALGCLQAELEKALTIIASVGCTETMDYYSNLLGRFETQNESSSPR